ncbi:hypothetical protein D6D17_05354 [Aureobasidium pullulans]|nr:hypothetical protein D6D17_05354 [Aureobasidium pullulans]
MELTTNFVALRTARTHSNNPRRLHSDHAFSIDPLLQPSNSPRQQKASFALWSTSADGGPGKYNEAESITCLRSREALLSRGTMLQDWSSRPVRVTVSSALTEDDSPPDKLRASRLPDAQD